MTAPKVSVIVTCFNLGAYLDEAVDSALTQTFQDLEVMIVDDGSTDEPTRRLLVNYQRPRTRVIRTENRGLSAARNAGAAATSGEYLCMLDADDRLEPTMIEKSVAALNDDASIVFVSHWLRTFGDEVWELTPTRCDLAKLLDTNTLNGAALVRRQAFNVVGGFDESMREGCEDWDFWISLLERGFQGRILPEVLFNYLRRQGSMSRLMMETDRHPRIYAQLAIKHAQAYRAHLETLVARREGERAHLELQLHDLALEASHVIDPDLARWRENVAALEARISRRQAAEAREASNRAASAALEAAEGAVAEGQRQIVRAEAQIVRETARADEAIAEGERLRTELATAERAVADGELRIEHAQAQILLETARADGALSAGQRLRAELAAIQEALASERGHVAALRERNAELDGAVSRATEEVKALRASRSWRLTAPIRALYDVLARMTRSGSRP